MSHSSQYKPLFVKVTLSWCCIMPVQLLLLQLCHCWSQLVFNRPKMFMFPLVLCSTSLASGCCPHTIQKICSWHPLQYQRHIPPLALRSANTWHLFVPSPEHIQDSSPSWLPSCGTNSPMQSGGVRTAPTHSHAAVLNRTSLDSTSPPCTPISLYALLTYFDRYLT